MTSPSLYNCRRLEVLYLYRSILKAGKLFFDPAGSSYIISRAREQFRRYKGETSQQKIGQYLSHARQCRRRIGSANAGDIDASIRVLDLAYGRKGKLKWMLKSASARSSSSSSSSSLPIEVTDDTSKKIAALWSSLDSRLVSYRRTRRRMYKQLLQDPSVDLISLTQIKPTWKVLQKSMNDIDPEFLRSPSAILERLKSLSINKNSSDNK